MAYIPYRDNPELKDVELDDRVRLGELAGALQNVIEMGEHEDACACAPGRNSLWNCISSWTAVPVYDPEEILAMAFARGLLKLPE